MKKAMSHTKVSVRLRKSELRDEWYLYLEAYPVFKAGREKPLREREYLNRIITTPMWDKTRPARLNTNGEQSFKPKRDQNGIIICRSKADRDVCIFADNVRNLRQHEYDNAELYSEADQAMAEKIENGKLNFIEYFAKVAENRHKKGSKSIIINWNRVYDLIKIYAEGDFYPFSKVTLRMVESFKNFMLTAPQGGNKSGIVSQNTAATYFAIFKAAVHQAFIDGYLDIDIAAKVKGIQEEESRREHLTIDELNILAATPCDYPMLKRAALFSALTGLRHCDIMKMKWSELSKEGEHYRINFNQKKTGGVEYMPISDQAYLICGEPRKPDQLVFEGLQAPSWINKPVKKWVEAAGIKKKITFHCLSHNKIYYRLTINELSITKNVTANDLETSYILFLSQLCNIQRTLRL